MPIKLGVEFDEYWLPLINYQRNNKDPKVIWITLMIAAITIINSMNWDQSTSSSFGLVINYLYGDSIDFGEITLISQLFYSDLDSPIKLKIMRSRFYTQIVYLIKEIVGKTFPTDYKRTYVYSKKVNLSQIGALVELLPGFKDILKILTPLLTITLSSETLDILKNDLKTSSDTISWFCDRKTICEKNTILETYYSKVKSYIHTFRDHAQRNLWEKKLDNTFNGLDLDINKFKSFYLGLKNNQLFCKQDIHQMTSLFEEFEAIFKPGETNFRILLGVAMMKSGYKHSPVSAKILLMYIQYIQLPCY
jgi:hypothetical protein